MKIYLGVIFMRMNFSYKALLLMLFTSTVFADSFNYQDPNAKDQYTPYVGEYVAISTAMPSENDIYFGLHGGADWESVKESLQVMQNGSAIDNGGNTASGIAFNGGAHLGGGRNFDRFYLGAELLGEMNTFYRNKDIPEVLPTGLLPPEENVDAHLSVKQNANFALDLMPGYLTIDRAFLFYGRLGYALGAFRSDLVMSPTAMPTEIITTHSDSKYVGGFRAGLGMEYFFEKAFSIRLEYVYTQYSDIKNANTFTFGSIPKEFTYNYKLSPHVHQVNVGAEIHF